MFASVVNSYVPILGEYALVRNAQMPNFLVQSARMNKPRSKVILSENLRSLMLRHGFVKKDGSPNQNALAKALKERNIQCDQTTIGRILNEGQSPTVDKLEGLADFFGLELWQMTTPGLDPKNLPVQAMSSSERDAVKTLAALHTIDTDGFCYPRRLSGPKPS